MGLAAALIVIAVIRSRAALISVIAVGLVVTYLLLIGGAQYLPSALVQRVSDFMPYLGGVDVTRVDVTDANWAVIERMAHWLAAVGMFSDHPWLGVALATTPLPIRSMRKAVGATRWGMPIITISTSQRRQVLSVWALTYSCLGPVSSKPGA